MASPLIKMDGKLIVRENIAWVNPVGVDDLELSLVTVDGTTHTKAFDTNAKAVEAHGIVKNLTEIDDLDGL